MVSPLFVLIYKLTFTFFVTNILLGSLAVISSRNAVHAVLALIFSFFNASCLFILLDAEFLAYLFLIVYVGAIAILFLFVVMMLTIKEVEVHEWLNPRSILIGFTLLLMLIAYNSGSTNDTTLALNDHNGQANQSHYIWGQYLSENRKFFSWTALPKNSSLGGLSNTDLWYRDLREIGLADKGVFFDPAMHMYDGNSYVFAHQQGPVLGYVMYSEYIIYLILAGVILLVAMIGAILITAKFSKKTKRQRSTEQTAREKMIKTPYILW